MEGIIFFSFDGDKSFNDQIRKIPIPIASRCRFSCLIRFKLNTNSINWLYIGTKQDEIHA